MRQITAKDRYARALASETEWCRRNLHRPFREQHAHLSRTIRGHCAYYGITGNGRRIRWYHHQPCAYGGNGSRGAVGTAICRGHASGHARTASPAAGLDRPPVQCRLSNLTREEPDAGNPHVRVCEGGPATTRNNEYLLPSKQVWSWYGSATSDANPSDNNPPVGGNNTPSWPSPENPAVTLYQPSGTATFTPITGVSEATAVGSAAAATAQNAVALGANAVASNTNAVALGYAASAALDHTTAIGTNAAASASYAQAIGYAASASGGDSLALGANATVANVESVGIGKSVSVTADDSVAIGSGASVSGLDGTAIGKGASAAYTNSMALGYQATTTAANSIVLGNSSISKIYAAVTSITAISDRRRKRDIRDIDLGLDFIAKLRPVSYRFRGDDRTVRYRIHCARCRRGASAIARPGRGRCRWRLGPGRARGRHRANLPHELQRADRTDGAGDSASRRG